jgi:hypothetical protein
MRDFLRRNLHAMQRVGGVDLIRVENPGGGAGGEGGVVQLGVLPRHVPALVHAVHVRHGALSVRQPAVSRHAQPVQHTALLLKG